MESGMPFSPGAKGLRHRVEAMALARALKGYSRVTVAITLDLDVTAASLVPLWRRVDEVVTASDDESRVLSSHLGVPPRLIRVDRVRRLAPEKPYDSTDVITPLGPAEWEWSEQPRRIVSLTARKVLGRQTDPVRARLVSLLQSVQRWLTKVPFLPERASHTG
jgi:hypothetical protein